MCCSGGKLSGTQPVDILVTVAPYHVTVPTAYPVQEHGGVKRLWK